MPSGVISDDGGSTGSLPIALFLSLQHYDGPPFRFHPTFSPSDNSCEGAGVVSPGKTPTIALCVTGSIAAYKAVEIARLLKKAGARVIPLLTESAQKFIGSVTLSGITGEAALTNMWDPSFPGELHVDIAKRADVVVIAPATADLLARLAQGRADDLLTALALCTQSPVIVAPAMHPSMWSHPAVVRNVSTLKADGRVTFVGPDSGEVASGDVGMGRMASPETIAAAALACTETLDLKGMRIVVSAGPTVEDLDPVRFIGNRSTGKMGFAIAERAAARGASVTLVAGPVSLSTPRNVTRIDVRGALAMRDALWQTLGEQLDRADIVIMTAAVADYRPATTSNTKLKRTAAPMSLDLVPNPDLLAEIGAARKTPRPVLVGFAVETDSDDGVVALARGKLQKKRCDMVIANHAADSFGRDDNRATLVTATDAHPFGVLPKTVLADKILDHAAAKVRA
ncbi:MAG: bifunctional phosphopantothenoylcysteine decarboxylase/phosphopantothenate--cysteine ligase CoaBC [Polyangiaceae bacterium]|nr:bifunctional phosphopantothenoylcysteine decarboxylase/phosphopantothenate--cysteine ligase CoaBC [Polyangiaceae bacterium]